MRRELDVRFKGDMTFEEIIHKCCASDTIDGTLSSGTIIRDANGDVWVRAIYKCTKDRNGWAEYIPGPKHKFDGTFGVTLTLREAPQWL